MFNCKRIFFVLIFLWSINIQASDRHAVKALIGLSFEELLQITVATGLPQAANQAPSVTSVITADDISNMGARTLEEVLQAVPGLQVSYSWYNIPIYTLRGISSPDNPEILVLINGIRANDSYLGAKSYYWTGFPVSMIERIEIIRGPGSALYGADAFSGVINLITKTANDINGTEVGFRVGNFNTQDAWVLHDSYHHGFNIVAMLDFSKTDGHQRIVESDAQTVWDNLLGTQVSLAPESYASDITTYDARIDISKQNWQFRAGVHKANDVGAGTGIGQALDDSKPMSGERINTDLTYHNDTLIDEWELKAQLSYLRTKFSANFMIFPEGAFGGSYPFGYIGSPSAVQSDSRFALSGIYQGFYDHTISVGAGYAYYDLYKVGHVGNFGPNPFTGGQVSPTELLDVHDTPAAFVPEVARSNWYMFIQDAWKINPDWELTAGLRYDKYSDFGSTTNPRLGLVWQVNESLTTKLLYGQAFRAPSFQNMYNQNNPILKGNPNLKPEQIETWELVFDYQASNNLHFALNLFHYDIEDKITYLPVDNSEFILANATNWKGKGLEFETRWRFADYSNLTFNYSFQDSEDKTTNTALSTAPKNMAYLRGDFPVAGDWYLNSQINWNDGWSRDANDPRSDLAGYTTVDLVLQHRNFANGKGRIGLGVRNVFDEDVRYPSPAPDAGSTVVNVPNDLPAAGRFYFFDFRYKF